MEVNGWGGERAKFKREEHAVLSIFCELLQQYGVSTVIIAVVLAILTRIKFRVSGSLDVSKD